MQRVVANRISAFALIQSTPFLDNIKRIPSMGASHPDTNSIAEGRLIPEGKGYSKASSFFAESQSSTLEEKWFNPEICKINPLTNCLGKFSVLEIFSVLASICSTASAGIDPRDNTLARNHFPSGDNPRQSVKVPPVSTKNDQPKKSFKSFIESKM